MSTCITTILYKKQELNQEFLFHFLRNLPEKLQAPELIPEEHFVHIDINDQVSAVFYLIHGIARRMQCFNLQCELFREEALLFQIKEELLKQQERCCLYSHLYCDMDDFEENLKLTEKGFEEISCMDGELIRSYREGENSTEQTILKTKEQQEQYPIDGILEELGITEADIINAAYRLEQEGIIIR
ncbi:hypothetical protein [Anaerocolumna chitinilytica]|uniref:Uncharacterized protein n=1 Tax=Anaerocolumna chitinilytica TaxID=1727145 RepID=A0A7I8DL58_9FIRM|nr:hypothetical protein [Anaerocolumna chitinilytica]BCJ99109.1 hypothetical protein bsdcttw_21500 [Anaerocolumna chitinilytica]